MVSLDGDSPSGWMYVDEPSYDTALAVGDLDRPVSGHEQESVDAHAEFGLVLLVDAHLLVGHYAVELAVVLDTAQVAIVLYCHKRVVLEHLGCERARGRGERLCVERHVISLEQLLHYVENRGLSGSSISVQD